MGSIKDLDKATMVLTSTYIMNNGLPILYISNDYDDEDDSIWQFHCDNGDYDMQKMLLVRLDTILNFDQTLSEISLEIGEEARRKDIKSKWTITKQ